MTCIVGLVHDGTVYIGGDSACSDGWCITTRADTKVFRSGPYVFGFTTSFRMGQLIRHALKPPAPAGKLDRFMATTFVDAIRQCLKDGGWAKRDSDREAGGQFLVGVAGRLFTVDSDYQVAEQACTFAAVGSGYLVALGAMHSNEGVGLTPRQRVVNALRAAERFTGAVRGPFRVATLRRQR